MVVVKEGQQRECEKAGLHHTAAAAAVRVCVAFRPQLPRLAVLWMAECTARLRCCAVLGRAALRCADCDPCSDNPLRPIQVSTQIRTPTNLEMHRPARYSLFHIQVQSEAKSG